MKRYLVFAMKDTTDVLFIAVSKPPPHYKYIFTSFGTNQQYYVSTKEDVVDVDKWLKQNDFANFADHDADEEEAQFMVNYISTQFIYYPTGQYVQLERFDHDNLIKNNCCVS